MHVTHVNIWKCSKCNSTWHACVRGKHLCMFLTCMLIVPTLQLLSFLFMLVSVTYTVSRYRFRMCTLNVHVAHVNIRNMKHAFLHNMHVWGRTLWCALLAQTTPTSSLHAPEKCMSKEKLHVNKQHACQKKNHACRKKNRMSTNNMHVKRKSCMSKEKSHVNKEATFLDAPHQPGIGASFSLRIARGLHCVEFQMIFASCSCCRCNFFTPDLKTIDP